MSLCSSAPWTPHERPHVLPGVRLTAVGLKAATSIVAEPGAGSGVPPSIEPNHMPLWHGLREARRPQPDPSEVVL
jgi:hypothetical protein